MRNLTFFRVAQIGQGMGIVSGDPTLERIARGNALALCAAGSWTARFAPVLERMVADAEKLGGSRPDIFIDVSQVSKLDTFGAWLIERLRRSLTQGGVEAQIAGLSANYSSLVDEVRRVKAEPIVETDRVTITGMLEQIGRSVAGVGGTLVGLIEMLGAVLAAAGHVADPPPRLPPDLDRASSRAGVLARGADRGADHVPDRLHHLAAGHLPFPQVRRRHLRGRHARRAGAARDRRAAGGDHGGGPLRLAYTAELGSMKMREEIDALRTMGFDPIEVLILPRMLALVLALPILAFLGAMAALYGGGLVAWLYGGVDPEAFLLRLRDAISIDHFIVGMIKAPVMAAVIGIVACVEGLAVQGSAESLGQHTTSSVVKGIFFVIVMDGVFAIFFASIGM